MRTPDVDLVEMAHPPIARGDGDVLELNVHVVFGCNAHGSGQRLPQIYAPRGNAVWGICEHEPSRSLPRYTWPEVISRVTTWPWRGTESVRMIDGVRNFALRELSS